MFLNSFYALIESQILYKTETNNYLQSLGSIYTLFYLFAS